MSDVMGFAEIDGQRVELLPARTMLQSGGGSEPVPSGTPAPAGGLVETTTGLLGGLPVGGLIGG